MEIFDNDIEALIEAGTLKDRQAGMTWPRLIEIARTVNGKPTMPEETHIMLCDLMADYICLLQTHAQNAETAMMMLTPQGSA